MDLGTLDSLNISQCLIPVIMSGILAVYSLVIAVLIAEDLAAPSAKSYSLFTFVESINLEPPLYTC